MPDHFTMASPFRTSSPSATNMPKENANGGLRKNFNVNVLSKATPSKNGHQLPSFTAANRPTENVHQCLKSTSAKSPTSKGMKNFMSPTFSAASKAASSKKRVVVERNESRPTCPPKSASTRSPASKEMKHFMFPTFSAASKASSLKKRVLVERNQSKHQIVHPCPPKPASAKSPVPKGEKNFMSPMFSAASKSASSKKTILVERNSEHKKSETPSKSGVSKTKKVESSGEQMDVVGITYEDLSFMSQFPNSREECTIVLPPYDPIKNYLSPRPDFLRYRPNRGLDDDVIEVDEGFRKRLFFKFEALPESGDPGEELTTVLPPYDPIKKNFLSPRPKFLRYRPNRSLEDDVIEVDEGFRKHAYFKSETPLESEVIETKEIESLGEQMDVGILAKSPVPKGMKNFMSPMFSAASKAASSKKRVYAESKLENVCPSPKSASTKSHAAKGVKNFMSSTFSAASKASKASCPAEGEASSLESWKATCPA